MRMLLKGLVAALVLVPTTVAGQAAGTSPPQAPAPTPKAAPPAGSAWFQSGQAQKTVAFRDLAGRFALEIPAKDWTVIAGGQSTLVVFMQKKNEATILIELQPMRIALEQSDVNEVYLGYRRDELLAGVPAAKNLVTAVAEHAGRRVVVLQAEVPAIAGLDTMRVYVFLEGDKLFRLICRAPQRQFVRYEPLFAQMAASFSLPGNATSSAATAADRQP